MVPRSAMRPRAFLGRLPGSCNLPRDRLAALSSKWPRPSDTFRQPQGPTFNPNIGSSTRVLSSRSQSIMAHPPSAPSAEPVIAQGEDEVLLKERLKALLQDSASPSKDGLWSMSADRMGLERQIGFRTFKLCWVGRNPSSSFGSGVWCCARLQEPRDWRRRRKQRLT